MAFTRPMCVHTCAGYSYFIGIDLMILSDPVEVEVAIRTRQHMISGPYWMEETVRVLPLAESHTMPLLGVSLFLSVIGSNHRLGSLCGSASRFATSCMDCAWAADKVQKRLNLFHDTGPPAAVSKQYTQNCTCWVYLQLSSI